MVLPDSPEGRLIFDHPSAGSAEEQVSFSGACATGCGCGKSEVFRYLAHEKTSTFRFIVLPNARGPEPAVALFPKSRPGISFADFADERRFSLPWGTENDLAEQMETSTA
jgi:hypothetical protein